MSFVTSAVTHGIVHYILFVTDEKRNQILTRRVVRHPSHRPQRGLDEDDKSARRQKAERKLHTLVLTVDIAPKGKQKITPEGGRKRTDSPHTPEEMLSIYTISQCRNPISEREAGKHCLRLQYHHHTVGIG